MSIDAEEPTVVVITRGDVETTHVTYAEDKFRHVVDRAGAHVLFAEIKLTMERDPARERPAVVEAMIDVNGSPLRAHVAAIDMPAAIDLLDLRLRRLVDRSHDVVVERRHGEHRRHRPEFVSLAVDDREVVRRKSFAPDAMTVDEAADLLDVLGHDFVLFRNLATESDAVVWSGEDGYQLIDQSDRPDAIPAETVAPVRISGRAVPTYTVPEAESELDLDLQPFVFFQDADTGTGSVLYNRFDGNYGLITLEA